MSQKFHLDLLTKPPQATGPADNTRQQPQPASLSINLNNDTNNNDNNNSNHDNTNRQTISADQRQAALASLFSSLSSLANGSTQTLHQQGTALPRGLLDALRQSASAAHLDADPESTKTTMTEGNPLTLTNSIQSVVAAAMLQRQLAASAAMVQQQQKQQDQPKTVQFQPEPAPTTTTTATTTAANATIPFDETQMCPSFTFGPSNSIKPELALGVASFNQFSACQQAAHQQQQLLLLQKPQQQQQRINYCTICNKELCNKYFMKTHMLKMHGISLEMEQPDDEHDQDEQSNGDESSSDATTWSRVKGDGEDESIPQDLTQGKLQKPSKPDRKANSNGPSKHQATSVLNGFAGNSMGGVICDICNKELCSKYFLKVHKQNTHGIVTDYQDASQFLYPFHAAAGPAPTMTNPFIAAAAAAAAAAAIPTSSATNPLAFRRQQQQQQQQQQPQQQQQQRPAESKKSAAKRARLMGATDKPPGAHCIESQACSSGDSAPPSVQSDEDLKGLYRLMLGHQQQAQFAVAPQLHSVVAHPVAANPLGALMCFGALGPFGASGMSPTMVVDYILRNQHLFNKNSLFSSLGGQNANNAGNSDQGKPNQAKSARKSATKASNANNSGGDKSKAGNNGKASGAKDPQASNNSGNQANTSNNSKYLSHYTEACPMCDRRFKSIKWLKTHMMNDHKQEIAACMQMMMQHLYASNATAASQQVAAVASMASAAFEQQTRPNIGPPTSQQNFQPLDSHGTISSHCLNASAGLTNNNNNNTNSMLLHSQGFKETAPSRQQQFSAPMSHQLAELERSSSSLVDTNPDRRQFSIKLEHHQSSTIEAGENLRLTVSRQAANIDCCPSAPLLIGSSASSSSEFCGEQQELNEAHLDHDEELDLSLNFGMENNKCNGVIVDLSNDTSDEFPLADSELNDDESIIVQDSDDDDDHHHHHQYRIRSPNAHIDSSAAPGADDRPDGAAHNVQLARTMDIGDLRVVRKPAKGGDGGESISDRKRKSSLQRLKQAAQSQAIATLSD